MATATLVPVEAYLETHYRDGDRDYIDGQILERNVGDIDHGDLQGGLAYSLRSRYGGRFWVAVGVRFQVTATRVRVPDVVVVEGSRPQGRILTVPLPCRPWRSCSTSQARGGGHRPTGRCLSAGSARSYGQSSRSLKTCLYTCMEGSPTEARLASRPMGSSTSNGSQVPGPVQRPCVPYRCLLPVCPATRSHK